MKTRLLNVRNLTTEYEKPKRERLPSLKGGNMTLSVAPPGNGESIPQGYCSRCKKVWIQKEKQGVCPWCHKPASCITATSKPRSMKSRTSRPRKQAPTGSGYDNLTGQYLLYYRIAARFTGKVRAQDQNDVLHDIIITLAEVDRQRYETLTEAAMYRIASRTVALYWRNHYRYTNGLTCGNCSKAQRRICREKLLYGKCPKAINLESLEKPVTDADGNTTELGNLIADDNALDMEAWTDARTFLLSCPNRLIQIAFKRMEGTPLDKAEQKCIERFRKREQKRLLQNVAINPAIRN